MVQELIALLKQEQTTLVHMQLDALESVLEQKSVVMQHLHQLTQQRYQMLAMHGYEASEQGMEQWIVQPGQAAQRHAWQSFQADLTEARELNRLNGVLINKHFNRNQQMLSGLQGGSIATYGKDGQAATMGRQRNPLLA